MGRELPEHDWFWPIFSRKQENKSKEEEEDNEEVNKYLSFKTDSNILPPKRLKLINEEKESESETYFIYSNGKIALEPPSFYELNENDLRNWLILKINL